MEQQVDRLIVVKEFALKHKRALIIVAAVVVVLGATFGWATAQMPKDERIVHGVVMDGVELGGMTIAEARDALSDSDFYENKNFTLISGTERKEVSGEDISLAADIDKSALYAYSIGRDNGFFANLWQSVRLVFSKIQLPPLPTVDEQRLDEIIYEMGINKNGRMNPAICTDVSETVVKVTPPTEGQSADVSDERERVLAELSTGNFGEILLDLPASKPEKMSAEQVYAVVYRPCANAEYKKEGKELQIIDELTGVDVDKAEISKQLSAFNSGGEIELVVERKQPEVTAQMLRENLFAAELASYSSTYSTAAANRAFNVSRAAQSVNGTILLPGETFSYNAAIGNPSLENGYKMASVYENGKTTEGVGGGVCQVSSTLYSAALYANLEIVERRSHSLTVAYVPKGQDATVSYGSLDFKFKNNTEHPIRIDASAKGGKCVVSIVGTAPTPAQTVTVENTVVAVNEPEVKETPNPDMAMGTRKVTSAGKAGYVVDSVRIVSENGEVVKTEKLTRSTYKMLPTEVMVGTKPEPTAEPTPEPEQSPTPMPEEPVTIE